MSLSKPKPEDPVALLKKIRKIECNLHCPNCNTPAQQGIGFGNVCMKYLTFVCDYCKSAHQAISHRCKSVTMSEWTLQEVQSLLDEYGGGNDAARHIWLQNAPAFGAKYPGGARPKQGDNLDVFKKFVEDCYEREKFKASTPYEGNASNSVSNVSTPKTPSSPRTTAVASTSSSFLQGGFPAPSRSSSSSSSKNNSVSVNLLDDGFDSVSGGFPSPSIKTEPAADQFGSSSSSSFFDDVGSSSSGFSASDPFAAPSSSTFGAPMAKSKDLFGASDDDFFSSTSSSSSSSTSSISTKSDPFAASTTSFNQSLSTPFDDVFAPQSSSSSSSSFNFVNSSSSNPPITNKSNTSNNNLDIFSSMNISSAPVSAQASQPSKIDPFAMGFGAPAPMGMKPMAMSNNNAGAISNLFAPSQPSYPGNSMGANTNAMNNLNMTGIGMGGNPRSTQGINMGAGSTSSSMRPITGSAPNGVVPVASMNANNFSLGLPVSNPPQMASGGMPPSMSAVRPGNSMQGGNMGMNNMNSMGNMGMGMGAMSNMNFNLVANSKPTTVPAKSAQVNTSAFDFVNAEIKSSVKK